jgi:hypothetical protein
MRMRFFTICISFTLLILSGCVKKDQLDPRFNPNCRVTSFTSSDPLPFRTTYQKTYDSKGLLTHVNTRLRQVYNDLTEYDLNISYPSLNTAKLMGTIKELTICNEDGDILPAPIVKSTQAVVFEARFDPMTHYFQKLINKANNHTEIEFVYKQGKFSRINLDFGYLDVKLDKNGNILSIRTENHYGLDYTYSDRGAGKNLVYEPTESFINYFYHLVEVLNWAPTQPNRERLTLSTSWGHAGGAPDSEDYYKRDFTYYHRYDNKGNLVGISYKPDWSAFYTNTFSCKNTKLVK